MFLAITVYGHLGCVRPDADINQITSEMKARIFSGVPSLKNDNHESFDDEAEEEAAKDCKFVPTRQREAPEEVFSELYHCFAHGDKDIIVDMSPGSGLACVAVARANRKYIGFVL